jgi:molecular chaperone DnaJ
MQRGNSKMTEDPYKVLGVSPSASDDEIQKAYRKLVKKYHPDVNPGDENAERKMREINAAYDQIRNIREGKATGGYSGAGQNAGGGYYGGFSWEDMFGGFGGFNQNYQEATTELTAARNYINSGHYREAMNVLDSVDISARGARWYYFHACAAYGLGNKIQAMNDAEQAVKLEPNNAEYQQFLNQMKSGGATYQQYGGGSPIVCGTSNICLDICLANLFCRFCCFPC